MSPKSVRDPIKTKRAAKKMRVPSHVRQENERAQCVPHSTFDNTSSTSWIPAKIINSIAPATAIQESEILTVECKKNIITTVPMTIPKPTLGR